jgi:DNA-binding MurR/RpiR family transcriptional regulator
MKQVLQMKSRKHMVSTMSQRLLTNQIVETFEGMSPQLQAAARYLLDRPRDVALLSMREQARKAGVQPATMTRLAQRLGLEGYDAVRELYAEAIRSGDLGFAGKAGIQVAHQKLEGERALAAEMIKSVSTQIASIAEAGSLDQLVASSKLLASARRVFCLGLRSSHSVAWHVHYVLSLLGDRTVLLDAVAGVGADQIRTATTKDVLLVASVLPYTRATVDLTRYIASRRVPIVAITDSAVSPIAPVARYAILVGTESPSFFHTMAPAFVVAEILAALVAGRSGEDATEALRRTEEQLAAFNVHVTTRTEKRRG